MSILLRKVPVINRHIMLHQEDLCVTHMIRKTLKELTKKHGEIAKKHRAFIFRLDPDVLVSDEEFKNIITELGYKTKKNIKDIGQVLQPKYVFRLDLKK